MKKFISIFALAFLLCLPLLSITQLSAQTAEEDATAAIVETGDPTAVATDEESTEEESTEDSVSNKVDVLRGKINGKANGLENAPGLQKPFNPNSKWGSN
jgi:uncharacterized membrane protein